MSDADRDNNDVLNKLSDALIQVSRGDPLVALRNETQAQFRAMADRLTSMDKATELQHQDLVRVPTLMDREMSAAKELLRAELKTAFEVLRTLIDESEKRYRELKAAEALALAAALQAAKEAVAEQNRSGALAISKSEAATGENIKQLQVAFQAANQATNEKIDDIKSRLDKGEGGSVSERANRTESRLDTSLVVSIVSAMAAVVAVTVVVLHH